MKKELNVKKQITTRSEIDISGFRK